MSEGYDRGELLEQLGYSRTAGTVADWDLLRTGAGNPIGNVWVKQAHDWVAKRTGTITKGFTEEEVAQRACARHPIARQRPPDNTPNALPDPTQSPQVFPFFPPTPGVQ